METVPNVHLLIDSAQKLSHLIEHQKTRGAGAIGELKASMESFENLFSGITIGEDNQALDFRFCKTEYRVAIKTTIAASKPNQVFTLSKKLIDGKLDDLMSAELDGRGNFVNFQDDLEDEINAETSSMQVVLYWLLS